jgi:hypothetical protein
MPLRSALATIALVVCTAAHADTLIAPGQTFLLGGEQDRPVQVQGRNSGAVAVDLLVRRRDGEPQLLQRAEPGQRFSATLPAGHTALARNTSATRGARVAFVFNGQIDGLSMPYEPATK